MLPRRRKHCGKRVANPHRIAYAASFMRGSLSMRKSTLVLVTLSGLAAVLLAGPSKAADLPVRESAGPVIAPADCGPCGCLQVTYDYHRDLRSTYGIGFDPRNFDQTQPHYYFGPNRAWPRYYADGVGTGQCWN